MELTMVQSFSSGPMVLALVFAVVFKTTTSIACCDPQSPFREGEGYAGTPATCANIGNWAGKAPDFEKQRISMNVRGRLSGVHADGAVAYLEMCDESALRIVCVTYQTNGMKAGDVVSFGGGIASINKE
jgi:hypothetical protein